MCFLIGSSIIMIPVLPKKMHWEKERAVTTLCSAWRECAVLASNWELYFTTLGSDAALCILILFHLLPWGKGEQILIFCPRVCSVQSWFVFVCLWQRSIPHLLSIHSLLSLFSIAHISSPFNSFLLLSIVCKSICRDKLIDLLMFTVVWVHNKNEFTR